MIDLVKTNQKLKSNFYLFFCQFWRYVSTDKLIEAKHIKFICEELQQLGTHIINRTQPDYDWLVINVPPGSSKSTIVSIMFPTWLLTNDPSLFIINTSYSDTLATGFIRKSKEIFNSTTYQLIFGKLELTKDNEGHIETKQGGGRFATSTGGTITGSHANIIISDDPISVEQAYSKAHIERTNRYMLETLPTRKRDKKINPQILIMQRLNEDDPSGNLLTKDFKLKHICLPAELSDIATNQELYQNGLLDPLRMDLDTLNNYKKTLGTYGYSNQFDQRPSPLEGGLIKREWFEIIEKSKLPFGVVNFIIDTAETENQNNDPTGLLCYLENKGNFYIINAKKVYLEFPELIKFIQSYTKEFGYRTSSRILIEPKSSGLSVINQLKQISRLNIIKIKMPSGESKFQRAYAQTPKMESGRVFLVKGEWNNDFLSEVSGFPKLKHDEYVDLLAYMLSGQVDYSKVFL